MTKGAATISVILAFLLGFIGGNIVGNKGGAGGPSVTAEGTAGTAAPAGGALADSDKIPVGTSPVLGPANALVTIVEFSDFQCPFCSRVEETIRTVRQHYGNDVRVVWKNNPLPFHQNATPAAKAAMAAHAQGKFWEMHDLLYANQQALAPADLDRYATQLHLNLDRFHRDMEAPATNASIEADKALAQRLNASGTPNFFINGTNLVGAQPVDRFNGLIDQVLARARTITPRAQVYAQMVQSPVAGDTPTPSGNQPPPQRPQEPDPNTVYKVPVGHSPVRGNANALVTMVIFSDFQCPFCSRVEATLTQLEQSYGNDLRVVWKNQPLEFHPNAGPAAELAMEAFAQQGSTGFWRMHDTLMTNQQNIARADLERYAQAQGLNMARVRDALDHNTHQADIAADSALARQIAANGTPHFFINGKRLVGAQPIERFRAVIDAAKTEAQALVRAGTPASAVYERITGNGATAPVYQNQGAAAAPTPGAPGGDAPAADRIYTVRANPHAPFQGGANARVVIEHFSDFQCPFCSRVNPSLEQVRTTYGDRVKIVWRNFPLDFHPFAMPAAEAALEAFAQQGNTGFWRYHDTLFANQTAIARADLERYAQAQGLDMTRFRAALDGHTHQQAIRDDMAAANETHAEMGTPASFVNGRFVSGAVPFAEFQHAIDAALAAH